MKIMDSFPYDKYCPSANTPTTEYLKRVARVEFGDGYSQAAEDGINTDISTISASWNNIGSDAMHEIVNFLQARLLLNPFLFKLPDWASPATVYCQTITKTDHYNGLYSISATFKRTATLGV